MRQLTEEEKWRDLVGGFILAFGEIEMFTHRLWAQYFPGRDVADLFDARTSALIGALLKEGEKNKPVVALLIQARKLAQRRNTVAHNPMQVQIFEHTKTGQWFVEHGISSEKNDDYIDDYQLMELRGEAEGIVSDLYIELGYVEKRHKVG